MNTSQSVKYLGVRVDPLVNNSNFRGIFEDLLKKGNSKIYTINPEFIVDAYYDSMFCAELNSSDINVIDGVGLLRGIKKYFKASFSKNQINGLKVLTGVDLTAEVLQIANEKKLSLFILGGSPEKEVSTKALKEIKKQYPDILIVGGSSDFMFDESDDKKTVSYIQTCMKKSGVSAIDVLLVGYGHKKQEFWISRNASKIPARVSIGVGGTLDYISGVVTRAPKFVRDLGMEWFFRLLLQPFRILRVFKATFIFSYLSRTLNQKNFQK